MKVAKSRRVDFGSAVKINGNQVTVKLGDGTGYTYSFFNDVSVTSSAIKDEKGEYTGMYDFRIKSKAGVR